MIEMRATFPDRRHALVRFLPALAAVHNPVLRDALLWYLHCLTAVPVLDLAALLRVTPPRRDDAAVAVLRTLYPAPAP